MTRWFFVVMVVMARVAIADPTERAKAAAHFKQGQEFFKVADYDRAITEYEAAYALSNEPLLIFNIGLCHDRAKRPDKALEAFQRYLAVAPTGDVADEAREDVARLTPIVDQLRRAAEQAREADAARRAQAAHDAEVAAQARQAAAERDRKRHEADARAQRFVDRARLETITAIASGAVAVIAGGVAIKYQLDASSAATDITNHQGAWTDATLARDADGKSAQSTARLFTTVSAVTAVTAGVLYVLARRDHHAASSIRLEVQPSGAAISLAHAF
jgi:tetratricopeptide (TPR) repeat protein